MAEYIDKYVLRKHLLDCYTNEFLDADMKKAIIGIDAYVENMPAADVQPVKRGKWKQIAPQSAICSQCGGALKSNGIDKTGKGYIFKAVYKYCPYCGTRMYE